MYVSLDVYMCMCMCMCMCMFWEVGDGGCRWELEAVRCGIGWEWWSVSGSGWGSVAEVAGVARVAGSIPSK
jgi:hypothetical protein